MSAGCFRACACLPQPGLMASYRPETIHLPALRDQDHRGRGAFVGRIPMLTATEKRIVKKARGLITPEERWTQDVFAAARGGHAVDPQDAEAFQFCALGALWRAAFELGERGFK